MRVYKTLGFVLLALSPVVVAAVGPALTTGKGMIMLPDPSFPAPKAHVPCPSGPVTLHVIMDGPNDGPRISNAFWSAGIPRGSHLTTVWDASPARAMSRAEDQSVADGGLIIQAPPADGVTVPWARGMLSGLC